MDKKLLQVFAVLAVTLFLAAPLCAKPWGIVTTSADYYADNESDNESLHTIDLGKTPPVVYGPFLQGELTARRGLGAFDIAMLPGNKKALVATINPLFLSPPPFLEGSIPSFMPSTSQISLVNLKDPTNPVLEDSIELYGEATDIAVTNNGKLAIVCLTGAYILTGDAVAGSSSSTIALINLKDFSYEYIYIGSGPSAVAENGFGMYAQSVAISRKNIAIFTDYNNGAVHYGKINKTRDGFESLRTLYLCEFATDNDTNCPTEPSRPVNVAISPDGRTALVAPGFGGALFVFEITNKGDLVPGKPFILTGLPGGSRDEEDAEGGQLSIAFRDNKTAYVVSYRFPVGYSPDSVEVPGAIPGLRLDKLSEISILGPGRTQYVSSRFDMLNSNFVYPSFGFESLDILKRHALIGNNALAPFENSDNESADNPYDNPNYNFVNYIDFATGKLTPVELNNYGVGTGVAIKP